MLITFKFDKFNDKIYRNQMLQLNLLIIEVVTNLYVINYKTGVLEYLEMNFKDINKSLILKNYTWETIKYLSQDLYFDQFF